MAGFPVVAAFQALSLIADALPNISAPTPIYAVLMSDTFLPLLLPDTWEEFNPQFETALSSAPMETGAFAVYNTVARPTTIQITATKAGSDLSRYAWLSAILQARASLPTQLYTLISPEGIYVDYAIARVAYEKRQRAGSNVLHLSITFQEVPAVPLSLVGGVLSFIDTLDAKSGPVAQVGRVFTNAVGALDAARVAASSVLTL